MKEQAAARLIENKTEKNGASVEREEDYKQIETLERISGFHNSVVIDKSGKIRRTVMQILVV